MTIMFMIGLYILQGTAEEEEVPGCCRPTSGRTVWTNTVLLRAPGSRVLYDDN